VFVKHRRHSTIGGCGTRLIDYAVDAHRPKSCRLSAVLHRDKGVSSLQQRTNERLKPSPSAAGGAGNHAVARLVAHTPDPELPRFGQGDFIRVVRHRFSAGSSTTSMRDATNSRGARARWSWPTREAHRRALEARRFEDPLIKTNPVAQMNAGETSRA
jgi:hypothetical protein